MNSQEKFHQRFNLQHYLQQNFKGSENHINAYVECCGRYADSDHTALIYEQDHWTFKQLHEYSAKLAHYFTDLGLKKGDRIAALLPRGLESLITMLAIWRVGAIYVPLFTGFEVKTIEHRLESADTQLIVIDATYRELINQIEISHILTVHQIPYKKSIDSDFWSAIEPYSTDFNTVALTLDDTFLMMFTSGTTGLAKSVKVPLKALIGFKSYLLEAVDVQSDDRCLSLADPTWAYGLYYGVIGLLALGQPILWWNGRLNNARITEIIAFYRVTNLMATPRILNSLRESQAKIDTSKLQSLRCVSSTGEPLNKELSYWYKQNFNIHVNDHYGQTETGMLTTCHSGGNFSGYELVLFNEENNVGILAVDTEKSPLFWFKSYGGNNRTSFRGQYYLTGDLMKRNALGSFEFISRVDDVILTSGYRLGPFDIEHTLLECSEVQECAVIGKPDPEQHEKIKAFVVLKKHLHPSDELKERLQHYVRTRLSKHVYPREIEFVMTLPKNMIGKIQRHVLKQQEQHKYHNLSYYGQ